MRPRRHFFVKRATRRIRFTLDNVNQLPRKVRGVYLLFQQTGRDEFETRYVGMSGKGRKGLLRRLLAHLKSKTKCTVCTHFEIYEFHKDISDRQIGDLEGILRHAHRKSRWSNSLNKARTHKPLYNLRVKSLSLLGKP